MAKKKHPTFTITVHQVDETHCEATVKELEIFVTGDTWKEAVHNAEKAIVEYLMEQDKRERKSN